ncbi:MAG: OmpH family outer membrane protein [Alphaproteobacteria bacterium]|nr:OmpH family outer membrane protein [Alphaproteobacteria bacterium]
MKSIFFFFAGLFIALAAIASPPAWAQDGGGFPPAVVAIVDMQGILRQADAARSIREQIEAKREAYGADARQQEEALKQDEQALLQQRSILSQEAFNQRRQEFQRKVQDFQRFVQVRTRQLDQGFSASMEQVREVLIEVIAEIVREKGINIVVGKGTIVIADTQLDISRDALERLNGRLQRVAVELPPLADVTAQPSSQ